MYPSYFLSNKNAKFCKVKITQLILKKYYFKKEISIGTNLLRKDCKLCKLERKVLRFNK